jgi:hypothetical protein
MESSKEKIEAQLCAYIEDELDERDRADIERHLQTNPQHKALIAELRKHRDLLQTLPRATVPGELNENLTGQLERSTLLSDDDETSEAGARINRWPQLTAVAAVLLLAVGLGIVVYYVLPPANGGRGPMAMEDRSGAAKRSPTSGPLAPAVVSGDKPAVPATEPSDKVALGAVASDLDVLGRGRGFSPAASKPALTDLAVSTNSPASTSPALVTTAIAPADAGVVKLRELLTAPGSVTAADVEELRRRMSRTFGGDANRAFNLEPRHSLYLIVETTNAPAASGQVASYFKTNNIQYMNYEGPAVDFTTDLVAKESLAYGDRDAAPDVQGAGAYGGGLSLGGTRAGRRSGGGGGGIDNSGGSGFGGAATGGRGASPTGVVAAQAAASGPEQQTTTRSGVTRSAATAPAYSRAEATPSPAAGLPAAEAKAPARAGDESRVARRGVELAQNEVARSRATTLPEGEKKQAASGAGAERVADAGKAFVGPDALHKAKLDAPAPSAPGAAGTTVAEKAMADAKDELSLASGNNSPNEKPIAPRPGAPVGQGQAAAAAPAPAERFAGSRPADTSWGMIPPIGQSGDSADGSNRRGGVIVARMNRRQAGELRAALSREQGQRAELRDAAGTGASPVGSLTQTAPAKSEGSTRPAAAGKPADARGDDVNRRAEGPDPVEGFRLTPSPMDEPVDVVIVVKPEATTPAAATDAGKSDAKK